MGAGMSIFDGVRYDRRVRALRRRGVAVWLLRQLRAAGPDALPQLEALEGATSAQIASINDAATRRS